MKLNDIIFGNSGIVIVSESQNLEQQTNGQSNDFERVDSNARHNQVRDDKFDNQTTTAVSGAVMTVENHTHDAVLKATKNVVVAKVEMVVKLITGSAGHGTSSEVQNPDRRDFSFPGNTRSTPLMSASSRLDLDSELNRNDETRNDVDSEDGDLPAIKPNYDQRVHAHHRHSGLLIQIGTEPLRNEHLFT